MDTLLTAVLTRYQRDQGLPLESADEQLMRKELNAAQRRWLLAFIQLWDTTMEQGY